MKKDTHPKYVETVVNCNGCNTTFKTHSTVPEITVEICSNCHPFYTGKQKLVDVAGRVDRFKAQQAAASKKQAAKKDSKKPAENKTEQPKDATADLKDLKKQLEQQKAPVDAKQ